MPIDDKVAELSQRLEALEDRGAIRDVIERYSRGLDRGDTDVMRAIFWPDATFPLGPPTGPATEFIEVMFGGYVGEVLISAAHLLGNSTIEIEGARASAETYAIAHHRTWPTAASNDAVIGPGNYKPEDAGKEHSLILGFRYLDLFEKREGEWRILERRLVFDWSQSGLYQGIEEGGLYEGTPLRGVRSREDPCYAR